MTATDLNPVRLAAVRTDQEAAMIVAELERHGIEARMMGETTSSFRAEVPGTVSVLVHRSDFDRAMKALEEVQQAPSESSEEEPPWTGSFFRRVCLALVTIWLATIAIRFLYSLKILIQ